MRAIPGRQMRGLPQGARLDCVDNSGAKTVEIVTVLNYKGKSKMLPLALVTWLLLLSKRKSRDAPSISPRSDCSLQKALQKS